jgi:hypothetical protein
MTKPTDELSMKEAHKWASFLNVFRTMHPRIEAQTIVTFLMVASHEGRTQQQIAELVGTTQSSVSRNLAALAQYGDVALDLVTIRENPENRRQKEVRLTPKGRMVIQQIRAI